MRDEEISREPVRHCPEDAELFELCHDMTADQRKDDILNHASKCSLCLEKISEIKKMAGSAAPREEVPKNLVDKTVRSITKSLSRDKKPRRFWRNHHIWLVLFLVFVLLSFGVRPFFIQMLVLAMFFGVKWLLAARAHEIHVRVLHEKGRSFDEENPEAGQRFRKNRGRSLHHNDTLD